ncbi:hypothetical protein [Tolypothrix sp. VBCCA 56010]
MSISEGVEAIAVVNFEQCCLLAPYHQYPYYGNRTIAGTQAKTD